MMKSQNTDSSLARVEEEIYPRLEATNKVVSTDRRILIWIVVAPYVALCIGIAITALMTTVDVSRITLAASIVSGVGALAGGIITYYFENRH